MDPHDLARFLENEQKVRENVKKMNADLLRWVETCPYCVHTTLKLFYWRFSQNPNLHYLWFNNVTVVVLYKNTYMPVPTFKY